MPSKKKNDTSALELERFEKKIKEFQDYLEFNDINSLGDPTGNGELEEVISADKRHKEIECQIKVMSALPGWIASLEKLREVSESGRTENVELRGDAEMNGLMRQQLNKSKK